MAKTAVRAKKRLKFDPEHLRPSDLLEEVRLEFGKKAGTGPFRCCGKRTVMQRKTMIVQGAAYPYEAWACPKCRTEYLDLEQAEALDRLWAFKKLVEGRALSLSRTVNFDGKAFFVRFPSALTKKWKKGATAEITLLGNEEFLVKIKA